jgi:hypothetical protein
MAVDGHVALEGSLRVLAVTADGVPKRSVEGGVTFALVEFA